MLHRLGIEAFRRVPIPVRVWLVQRTTPKYTLGVLVVLTRADGRVLGVRQRYRPGWFLPGGTLKKGETVLQAAHREVLEELGITLPADPLVLDADQSVRRSWVTWHTSAVLPDELADCVRAVSPELAEVRWLDEADLARPDAAVPRKALRRAEHPD